MNWQALLIYGGLILFVYAIIKTDDDRGNYKS